MSNKPIDLRDHDLSGLLTDATGLFRLGRKYSALLLLLCLVDALAARAYPKQKGVRQRFERFLRIRLPKHTRVQNFNIRVPSARKTFRLEEIVYKYLRNPIVHESAQLKHDAETGFPVLVD